MRTHVISLSVSSISTFSAAGMSLIASITPSLLQRVLSFLKPLNSGGKNSVVTMSGVIQVPVRKNMSGSVEIMTFWSSAFLFLMLHQLMSRHFKFCPFTGGLGVRVGGIGFGGVGGCGSSITMRYGVICVDGGHRRTYTGKSVGGCSGATVSSGMSEVRKRNPR